MVEECAVFGWSALAQMVGKSKRAIMRRKTEMRQAGAIFYTMKRHSSGRSYRAMFFFPSMVKAYLAKLSEKSEDF